MSVGGKYQRFKFNLLFVRPEGPERVNVMASLQSKARALYRALHRELSLQVLYFAGIIQLTVI